MEVLMELIGNGRNFCCRHKCKCFHRCCYRHPHLLRCPCSNVGIIAAADQSDLLWVPFSLLLLFLSIVLSFADASTVEGLIDGG